MTNQFRTLLEAMLTLDPQVAPPLASTVVACAPRRPSLVDADRGWRSTSASPRRLVGRSWYASVRAWPHRAGVGAGSGPSGKADTEGTRAVIVRGPCRSPCLSPRGVVRCPPEGP